MFGLPSTPTSRMCMRLIYVSKVAFQPKLPSLDIKVGVLVVVRRVTGWDVKAVVAETRYEHSINIQYIFKQYSINIIM